jgi:phosphoribosylformimino-5-aminoimidazole carboxamide ribotide isomerase
METVDYWLNKGITRVILGTVALHNPDFVKEACAKWPGRIAVGIDARDGYVAVEGWAETSEVTALELAQKFEDCGVTAIIFTDIDRDGAMGGPNIESTVALASAISTPVIVSGGVSSLDDLIAVAKHTDAGIDGAISGRALYDGRIDLAEAIRALS